MDRYEQILFSRLFQPDTVGWMQLIYLTGMFVVLMWRKEAIVGPKLFRASYLFFGASLVAPAIAMPLIQSFAAGNFSGRALSPGSTIGTQILVNAIGPVCFAGAVICGLASMAPPRKKTAPAAAPTPHPLD